MRIEQNDIVAGSDEIPALAAAAGAGSGPLSALAAGGAAVTSQAHAFDGLAPAARDELHLALRTLADPVKRLELHTTVADESVARMTLAWARDSGERCALLARLGSERRVGMRSTAEARVMLMNALAATETVQPLPLRIQLSTAAALVLLAIADQLRLSRLISMIKHVAPVELFAAADVAARIAAAREEDFRWPLNFVDKLLPLPLHELSLAADLPGALDELETKGLISRVGSEATATYELAPAGSILVQTLLHDVSRAGLALTVQVGSKSLAHDVALLVRSALHLVLFYLSGGDAAIRFLDAHELDAWLGGLLAFVPPAPPAPRPATVAEPTLVLSQPRPAGESTLLLSPPALALDLVVAEGAQAGQRWSVSDGTTLGRQPDNGIVIAEPGISRHHARFTRESSGWSITDLRTSNGTYLNDRRLSEPSPLRVGDLIRVGKTRLRVTGA